jgi:DNA-3-methyladenine glycosylase II
MAVSAPEFRSISKHFRAADPVIAQLIKQVGPFELKVERNRFGMLVRSIISQQISTGAARSIRLRLEQLVAPQAISPASIAPLQLEQLRSVGLSGRKAEFVLDLARRANDGSLRLEKMGRLSDEEVIEQLIQVRGIGRWTAQMFLIFSLGRLDVFPFDDFGVRSAIRHLYGFDELPSASAGKEIGERWKPYATVASWYCWRSIDLRKK